MTHPNFDNILTPAMISLPRKSTKKTCQVIFGLGLVKASGDCGAGGAELGPGSSGNSPGDFSPRPTSLIMAIMIVGSVFQYLLLVI